MSRLEPKPKRKRKPGIDCELELKNLYGMTGEYRRSPAWRVLRWRLLLDLAHLENDEADSARAWAIRRLHRLYILQNGAERRRRAAAESGLTVTSAQAVDQRLADLFKGLAMRAVGNRDPAAAWDALLNPGQRRGPKVKNSERDIGLAIRVQEKIDTGATPEDAYLEIHLAERRPRGLNLSESAIKKIYLRLGEPVIRLLILERRLINRCI